MADQYAGSNPLSGSAFRASAITPSDVNDLPSMTKALYVGVGGDVTVLLAGDTAPVTFVNVGDGTILPIRVARVYAATTATSILGLF